MNHSTATPARGGQTKPMFILFTAVAATTAALAAGSSLLLSLPVWAMFVGWVAFFSRGLTLRDGLVNLGCVLMGLAVGMGAALSIGALSPSLGPWALPLVVFVVAMLVVSLRSLRVMNNIVAYFLGLIAWFAAHLEPSLESFAELGGAGALGTFAGWLSHAVQQRLPRRA
ncbi:DUF1097 domain-containing protein [Pseudomonas chlororaphis]|jgi:hypothetical protein|uniref:DUF1097 domain-containing protein n=1 Tax=Pseudomonas chlororaphis TaxID=587753 RepID=UPI00026E3E30|nr:DUF1097 domain-containing protein [Pseudomonas chlororaphis]AZD13228.1 hypothetical protein C4K25_0268 [Pseudomonas chlororaphis]EJL00764.1 putative membrane protein [Pseudomonas chlororaphis subsp. aureofaciens 30-84]ROL81378.1 hypothetical protein BK636_15145 [Pseudomonas chlororaphis]WDH47764.1 DUF1097 domain-containing protein [Pseudomonas chlororaphis]WDH59611.1 DUF1097 domain-containing protein [Pseudomonas chlororaphis]